MRQPNRYTAAANPKAGLRVAIIHDWLTGMRGGEVVLEALIDLFPKADLFTLLYNKGSVSQKISDRTIHTSFIDRLPLKSRHYRHYLPLFPLAIEGFRFEGYDLVFSSTHCVARGAIVPPGVVHISYFHSPMRYVWDMQHEYFPPKGLVNRLLIPPFAHYLRLWDYSARDRVDGYICNSHFVKERIRRFYGKDAVVVPPPCLRDASEIRIERDREDFYLVLSALVPYKRIDQAVEAFRGLPDRRLLVVGTGPEEKRLRKMAPENVQFTGRVGHSELKRYYQKASALLFPGKEDFGIVPVEAQSFGCPVIAFGEGGVLDTVLHKKTGILYSDQSPEGLRQAILMHEKTLYKASAFVQNVKKFTKQAFHKGILKQVRAHFPGYKPPGTARPSASKAQSFARKKT